MNVYLALIVLALIVRLGVVKAKLCLASIRFGVITEEISMSIAAAGAGDGRVGVVSTTTAWPLYSFRRLAKLLVASVAVAAVSFAWSTSMRCGAMFS